MFANSFLAMSSDPYRLFKLRRTSDHIDLHYGWRQSSNLFLYYVSDSREHGRAIRQHSVDVQVLTHVQITLHDRIVWGLVDACRFHTKERGLEHGLRASKAPRSQHWWPDHREVHSSSLSCSSRQQSAFLFEVAGNIADIFFNVTRDHMGQLNCFPLTSNGHLLKMGILVWSTKFFLNISNILIKSAIRILITIVKGCLEKRFSSLESIP